MRRVGFILICLSFTAWLHAEPLDRRQLPPNTAWLVHIDIEAANASRLFNTMRDQWLATGENRRGVDKANDLLGIDILHDIRSVTLFSTSFAQDTGVLIFRGKVNHARLLAVLQKMEGYRTSEVAGHRLYYWAEKRAQGGTTETAGAFVGNDMVVISCSTSELTSAIDRLQAHDSVVALDSVLARPPPPGTILEASATGLANARGLSIQSPVVRQCESGWLAIGDHEGTIFLSGQINTQSPEIAADVESRLFGLRALALLQAPRDPWIARLLQPLKLTADDKTVDMSWSMTSSDLIQFVKSRPLASGGTPAPAAAPTPAAQQGNAQ